MKEIFAKEYAEMIGVSQAIVTRRLQENALPGIKKAEKWGNTWRITIPEDFDIEDAKSYFDLSRRKNKK